MLLFSENSQKVQEGLDKRLGALTRLASLGAAVPNLDTRVSSYGLEHPLLGFLLGLV